MEIPSSLEDILKKDSKLHGAIISSLHPFETWIKNSKTPFFPEYTDHGIDHIQDVLKTTQALISDESWEIVSPGDVATLVLASVLHDSAMHITEDGFVDLIENGESRIIDGFGDKPWAELWEDFIGEAKRFDGKRLMELFGDTEPVQRIKLNPENWSDRDKKLIGEFIRRHHSRLAHEIAILGVPGPETKKVSINLYSSLDYIKDLAGLVGRSHGMEIRSCFDYLKRFYNGIWYYKNVHAVFLMALVRVADYLQVHAERAPKELLKVKELKSPISKGEWKAHNAIKDISPFNNDPEAISVFARPNDVRTYLKLNNLLEGLQREIDNTWAVLGEVYGRIPELRDFGITIRRITSNILNVNEFAKTVDYIPTEAHFKASDTELFHLLVRPLYGNRPDIGIRELIQNAVDSCRELEDYFKNTDEIKEVDLQEQEADVIVTIEERQDGTRWVTVSDKGVGMTIDVILDYFLKIGASFRSSDSWKKIHEKEGKSKVLRSGRFGVGVLAAFLIGDTVKISSRHISSDKGIQFEAAIDSTNIELRHIKRAIGTTVEIQVIDEKNWEGFIDQLKAYKKNKRKNNLEEQEPWNWYCLNDPSLKFIFVNKNENIAIKPHYRLPMAHSRLSDNCHRIEHPDFDDIQWTYGNWPDITCNGIIISEEIHREYELKLHNSSLHDISVPCISVFDKEGKLPLNLQRTEVENFTYPFEKELHQDIVKDILAYYLTFAPHGTRLDQTNKEAYNKFCYPGFQSIFNSFSTIFREPWCLFSTKGITIAEPWPLQELSTKRILIVPEKNIDIISDLKDDYNLPSEIFTFSSSFSTSMMGPLIYHSTEYNIGIKGIKILASEAKWKHDDLEINWKNINSLTLGEYGHCQDNSFNFETFSMNQKIKIEPDRTSEIIAECYFSNPVCQENSSPLSEAWKKYIRSPIIPYDLDERHKKCKYAYDELAEYIEKWEAIKQEEEAKKKDPTQP